VRGDKIREVLAGHDGTWVAHPGLVPIAKEIFDRHMPGPNQITRQSDTVQVSAKDLLAVPDGTITENGLRWNIDVSIRYVESWLRSVGCVPIYNLMEDTATAEICRMQVWQWLRFSAALEDGRPIREELVSSLIASELKKIKLLVGVENFHKGLYRRAASLLEKMMTAPEPPEFLTVAAYDHLD
jgi:malate synthase